MHMYNHLNECVDVMIYFFGIFVLLYTSVYTLAIHFISFNCNMYIIHTGIYICINRSKPSPQDSFLCDHIGEKTQFGWANEKTKESRVSLPHPPLELKMKRFVFFVCLTQTSL